MKKITVLLFGLLLASAGVHVNAQRIKGSDTVLPIAQQTAERFMQEDPDARVTVTGGGSGVGISALLDSPAEEAAWAYPPCWTRPRTSPWLREASSSAKP